MEFIASDTKSKKIKKLAIMLKTVDVNVYIYGERGTGKTFLANFISNKDSLIIENFDNLKHFPNINNKRIITTGSEKLTQNIKDKFDITIEIELEPLKKREKDLEEFINLFTKQVKRELKIEKDFQIKIDISENLNSLKNSIYKSALCKIDTKKEIIEILENYFDENYYENSSYNEELKMFDEALIKSMKKKYKSKLQMAKVLKINRATLSKKVDEIENRYK
jgi:DNA-binding NtrC family response regulator